jgi:cysteine synthase A
MINSLIGNTPIFSLSKIVKPQTIFLKIEKNNLAGSIKDRPAFFMINDAEKKGFLNEKQKIIVEPTSGNTGIALAAIGKQRGYEIILTMPETASIERRKVLEMFGAKLILTDGSKGMKGAIEKAVEIESELNAFMPDQFSNPANPLSHELTTGPEILKGMRYDIDGFVAGVGTGGTISGVGRALRKFFREKIKIYAAEPEKSSVLSGNSAGKHKIQGIGPGFISKNFDSSLVDGIITVDDEEALEMTFNLAKNEGLFAGISTGANVVAAIKLQKLLGENSKIVTIACDHGERYLSAFLI